MAGSAVGSQYAVSHPPVLQRPRRRCGVVERFVSLVGGQYDVRWKGEQTLLVSRATLPEKATIVVLGR